MALTEIYIDPSIAGNSGTGTSGDPYGDLQYALTSSTFDTTNGTRLNIKAGTDEVLTAALNWETNFFAGGGTTETAQLFIQGYTSTAGDGGEGGISGGGTYVGIDVGTRNYVHIRDMHIHNTGSALCIDLNNWSSVVRTRVDNTTGNGILLSSEGLIANCYVTNVGGVGIVSGGASILFCEFVNSGGNSMTYAIDHTSGAAGAIVIIGNKIKVSGTTNGIRFRDCCAIAMNSIYSASGSGNGIMSSQAGQCLQIVGNVIEGFSTGNGISLATSSMVPLMQANSFYSCGTTVTGGTVLYTLTSETLGSTAFPDIADPSWAPVNVGTIIAGMSAWQPGLGSTLTNNLNRGAVQSAAGGGASNLLLQKSILIGN